MKQFSKRAAATAVTTILALPVTALAQSSTGSATTTGTQGLGSTEAASYSLLPTTSRGYIGLNLGKPSLDVPCVSGYECSDADFGGKIYTGGLWNDVLGLELGYINFGETKRAGGNVKAQGANLSLVGNLPIAEIFNVFAKLGTTYAWTDTSAAALSGVATGSENGFALSYGGGLGFDLTRNFSIAAEWERHRLKFAGDERRNADLVSLGANYRF